MGDQKDRDSVALIALNESVITECSDRDPAFAESIAASRLGYRAS